MYEYGVTQRLQLFYRGFELLSPVIRNRYGCLVLEIVSNHYRSAFGFDFAGRACYDALEERYAFMSDFFYLCFDVYVVVHPRLFEI